MFSKFVDIYFEDININTLPHDRFPAAQQRILYAPIIERLISAPSASTQTSVFLG